MDELDRSIINTFQGGLRICERPYLEAAQKIGVSEEVFLARLTLLLERGTLTRIGPLFQIERMGGAFTLAALRAPEESYERIAASVNALPEVAHNYQRDNALNMWFVVAAETPDGIERAIQKIETDTGCEVFNFPKSREYFIELKLTV
jgi:siroheme decarboxylase